MVGYYRVSDLGFRVAPGSFVLPVEGFAPVAEASALIEAAQARAEEIVADAVEARETEKQRGFEEGLREARLAAIERMLRESVVLDARLRDVEKDLTGLVVACTRSSASCCASRPSRRKNSFARPTGSASRRRKPPRRPWRRRSASTRARRRSRGVKT